MGYEFRLTIRPPLIDLRAACESVCADSAWRCLQTSLRDVPNAVGVGAFPFDPAWPQDADFAPETDGRVYVLCHCARGTEFLQRLVAALRSQGLSVDIDDDI